MKHAKRLFSTLLVLLLTLSLATAAFAATEVKLQDKSENKNSTYYAYQLLTAEQVKGQNTATDPSDDLYKYQVNKDYLNVLKAVTKIENETAIVEYIADLTRKAPDVATGQKNTRDFADKVFAEITAWNISTKYSQKNISGTNTVTLNLPEGYWLITETVDAGENYAVTSLVMLDTVGKNRVDLETKENKPSSQKKVKDIDDGKQLTGTNPTNWQDGADWDIGDDVPFQLTGTLPENYGDYKHYYLAFHDQQSAGLTFNENSVRVYVFPTGKEDAGTEITTSKNTLYTVKTAGLADGCAFEIEFLDVTSIVTGTDPVTGAETKMQPGGKIVVEYTSKLNENAVIGSAGNPNEMRMEYSNDPYNAGDGTKKPGDEHTGHTPWDKVIVFTFRADVNKVDGAERPLTGADFGLYKFIAGASATAGDDNAAIANIDGVDGAWVKMAEGNGIIIKAKEDDANGAKETKFIFKGLDAGHYKLVETKVPDGYNKADDVYFTIVAKHDEDKSDDPKLKSLTVQDANGNLVGDSFDVKMTPAENKPNIETTIMNLTGAELPSTGGMGTTLFYIVGGVLVAAAVILLITRKRVNNSDK